MNSIIFIILFILVFVAILKRPYKLHEGTIAFIGALLVLVLGVVSPTYAMNSIVGTHSHPWQIIIFFITFAIISTTLEDLGFFRWCAIHTTNLAKHDGRRLFNYLFLVTAIVTFLTANDIVILTLTPFFLHLGLHHNRHPKAYLFMLFFVANTGSLGHLLGNLTNIIVSNTFNITFLEFLKYLFLPMIGALGVEYLILRWYFRKEINDKFKVDKTIKPHHAIKNKGKIYLVLGILLLIIVMALLEPLHGVNLWILTTSGAFLTIILGRFNPIKRFARVPWQVILFVISLFVIISGFTKTGLLDHSLSLVNILQEKSLLIFTIFGSFLASIVSAVMNNIPGTITMSDLIVSSSIAGVKQQSIIFSTIVGSNLGANFTIIGALAGLMWIHLIREKKYRISAIEFSKIGILTMIPTVLTVSLILFLELKLF